MDTGLLSHRQGVWRLCLRTFDAVMQRGCHRAQSFAVLRGVCHVQAHAQCWSVVATVPPVHWLFAVFVVCSVVVGGAGGACICLLTGLPVASHERLGSVAAFERGRGVAASL